MTLVSDTCRKRVSFDSLYGTCVACAPRVFFVLAVVNALITFPKERRPWNSIFIYISYFIHFLQIFWNSFYVRADFDKEGGMKYNSDNHQVRSVIRTVWKTIKNSHYHHPDDNSDIIDVAIYECHNFNDKNNHNNLNN